MHQYRRYAEGLRELAQEWSIRNAIPDMPRLDRALNGEAADMLVERVPVDVLRRAGAFFTPPTLAEKLAERVAEQLVAGKSVLDPACGAGDLLLACARSLRVESDLAATLEAWGVQLHGFDIHPEFITTTKARLVLLAIARGARGARLRTIALEDVFPNIRHEDFLAVTTLKPVPGCIVVNPPFQRVATPSGVAWTTGLVTRAALFMDRCTGRIPVGTWIAALLPDVLRSGSRYTRWRQFIEERASIRAIEPLGVFNDKADVDVFLVTLTTKAPGKAIGTPWLPEDAIHDSRPALASVCSVRVGPVVPFRDRKTGPSRPYITTAVLPAWKTTTRISRRKYGGETFSTPFVAVRRTSRPNDRHRAVATIMRHTQRVAVENHVIVLLPCRSTLKECKYLLRVLRDPRTTRWLNERICCRHLTTAILKQLPLWIDR